VVQGAPGVAPSSTAVNRSDFLLVRRRGRFVKVFKRSIRGRRHGSGDTVTTADDDRDGRPDVFVTNGYFEYEQWNGRSTLFRNRSRTHGFVGLRLDGGRWNPLGIGARVRVRSRHFRYVRELTDGVTFRSQSEIGYVNLGMRNAPRARIRVSWRRGRSDCIRAKANIIVRVVKGSNPCSR
jgi:hypothetical protein